MIALTVGRTANGLIYTLTKEDGRMATVARSEAASLLRLLGIREPWVFIFNAEQVGFAVIPQPRL